MENNTQEIIATEPTVEPKQEEAKPVVINNKEKRSGKDEKSRKKDDRNIEQILKSLNGLNTPEEKLSAMCKKYNEVVDENRKLQMSLKQMEKAMVMSQREKEQCQSEKSKAVLAKSRLESLCRELQRQNKAVKEESILKLREEEEKRKEVSAKFQSTLTEITALMAETNDKNVKLHEDNIEIHKKFKSVFDEMDIREQHFESMHQVMKQELQVADAKLAKVTLEMTEERELLLKEKNLLLLKLTEYQSKIKDLQAVETNLRSQVEMYTEKYDEFQNALSKSNEIFGGFNSEMEKMSKKILKLEKETNMWKTRWEKSHNALLDMATDKQTRDAEIVQLNKKCQLLQELCKAFQQERATLLVQLKGKTNEPLESDGNQILENYEGESALNGLTLSDNAENKINDESQNAKTEETTTKIDEPNTKTEENQLPETPVTEETNSDVAKSDGENRVDNENKAKAVEVLAVSTTETPKSSSEQVDEPLEAIVQNPEVSNNRLHEATNDPAENSDTSATNGNVPNPAENSDTPTTTGNVQNTTNDKKPKDGKKKKK